MFNCSSDDSIETSTPTQPSSVQIVTIATLNGADGLDLDQSDNIYASNYGIDIVYKIDSNNNITTFINNQDGAAGIVYDNQGFMYLARYESADIIKISADGNTIETCASAVSAPIALDLDSECNLYNNVNSAITKIDSNGNKTSMSISLFNNSSLTIDNNANINVSDYDSGKIIKIDANTNQENTFANFPISGAVGFIIYSNGNFYITTITNQLIFKIDSNGEYKIIAGIQSQAGVKDVSGNVAAFNKPVGIVASPNGETLLCSTKWSFWRYPYDNWILSSLF